jgi:hypothetical protein
MTPDVPTVFSLSTMFKCYSLAFKALHSMKPKLNWKNWVQWSLKSLSSYYLVAPSPPSLLCVTGWHMPHTSYICAIPMLTPPVVLLFPDDQLCRLKSCLSFRFHRPLQILQQNMLSTFGIAFLPSFQSKYHSLGREELLLWPFSSALSAL